MNPTTIGLDIAQKRLSVHECEMRFVAINTKNKQDTCGTGPLTATALAAAVKRWQAIQQRPANGHLRYRSTALVVSNRCWGSPSAGTPTAHAPPPWGNHHYAIAEGKTDRLSRWLWLCKQGAGKCRCRGTGQLVRIARAVLARERTLRPIGPTRRGDSELHPLPGKPFTSDCER
jgi:hypothetical protein